jgi:hypothetical protein
MTMGGETLGLVLDVLDEQNVTAVFRKVADRAGGLTVLVDSECAGTLWEAGQHPICPVTCAGQPLNDL